MARMLRVEFPGALYFVQTRGNNNQDVFQCDEDRGLFLELLAAVVEKYHWVCHAYCLMSNNYQLLLETPEANLSRGMRQLNGMYTQQYNKSHGFSGHVLQGRFAALVLERDPYLLEVCREMLLSPVRSKEVNHPRAWRWSSFLATAGVAQVPGFLHTEAVRAQFGTDKTEIRHGFTGFVLAGLEQEQPWGNIRKRIVLGSDEFVARTAARLDEKAVHGGPSDSDRYPERPSIQTLLEGITTKAERNRRIVVAHVRYGYTLKEIGRHLGMHYSTVSKAAKRGQTL